MDIQMIGFKKLVREHSTRTLLGFATVLLPGHLAIPNFFAAAYGKPSLGGNIQRFDNGACLLSLTVYEKKETGETLFDLPSICARNDPGTYYDVVKISAATRGTILDLIENEMDKGLTEA